MSSLIYYLLYKGENIKIEKIKTSAKYMEGVVEKKLQSLISKNDNTFEYISKVEKMISESKIRMFGLTSVYVFCGISIIIGIIIFREVELLLNNVVASGMIGAIAICIPFELLKMEVSMQRRSVRKHLPHFFLTILQLFEATEDMIEVIETSADKFKNPLRQHFKEFLYNYNSGKDIEFCSEILKSRVENPLLLKFVDDMESNIKNGTRLKGIIEEYIIKAYNNQINYSDRITENTGNLTGAVMLIGIFIYMIYSLNKLDPGLLSILVNNIYGKMAVDAVILLMLVAVNILRHSVSFKDNK